MIWSDDVTRAVLIAKADKNFWRLIWATVVLFVGVIMEEVHPLNRLHTHNVNTRTRVRTPRIWVIRSKGAYRKIAILLVVVGIAGEGTFEYLGAKAEDKVRDFDNGIAIKAGIAASSAEGSAQRAQGSANVADIDAGDAKGKSNDALVAAGGAERKAGAVEEEAKELDTKLADEKAALTDLAICNAPRVIGFRYANGKLSIAPLLPYKGTEATIEFMPDAESRRAAMNIYGAIGRTNRGAGWNPSRPKVVDGLSDGVLIVWYTPGPPTAPPPPPSFLNRPYAEEARAAAEGLKGFLHSEYWQADSRDRFSNEPEVPIGGVKILVGLYPARALVTPPAEAAVPIPKLPEETDKQPCRPLSDLVANP